MNITKTFSIYNLVSLITVLTLAACGGSFNDKVGEVLNESKIISVSIDPNPAPKPVGSEPTPILLKVKVNSTSVLDVITVNVKNPANSGQYSMLAFPRPCLSIGACGVTTYEIQCSSYNAVNSDSLRTLSCGGFKSAVTLPPGTHPMLIEIRDYEAIYFGFRKSIHDSTTVNFVIQ